MAHFVWNLSWIPQKLKRISYKHLSTKKGAPDVPFSIDFFGMHYEGNLNNSIEFNIFYYGAFEKPLLFFLPLLLSNLDLAKVMRIHPLFNIPYFLQLRSCHQDPFCISRTRGHFIALYNISYAATQW